MDRQRNRRTKRYRQVDKHTHIYINVCKTSIYTHIHLNIHQWKKTDAKISPIVHNIRRADCTGKSFIPLWEKKSSRVCIKKYVYICIYSHLCGILFPSTFPFGKLHQHEFWTQLPKSFHVQMYSWKMLRNWFFLHPTHARASKTAVHFSIDLQVTALANLLLVHPKKVSRQ